MTSWFDYECYFLVWSVWFGGLWVDSAEDMLVSCCHKHLTTHVFQAGDPSLVSQGFTRAFTDFFLKKGLETDIYV